uniref:Uncharacterized protein n=1 Tax=candidate division WOR-3 bacterium TaxID=2052148 RepID=A0A7C6AAR4_UNCW3
MKKKTPNVGQGFSLANKSKPNPPKLALRYGFCSTILLLFFSYAYSQWALSQDARSRGVGNVSYVGYLTVPVYFSGSARDSAIAHKSHAKFQTVGGYLQFGIAENMDVGIHGNTSNNSSIGLHLKFSTIGGPNKLSYNQFGLATLLGFDYVFNELLLAPFGVLMVGQKTTNFLNLYAGLKGFHWPNMIIQENPKEIKNVFGLVPFLGMKVYKPQGWEKGKIYSSLPTGIYFELAYPANIESKGMVIVIGVEGILGVSLRNL